MIRAVVITLVVAGLATLILVRQWHLSRARAARTAAAQEQRHQRLAEDHVAELRRRLQLLGELAAASDRYWSKLAAGEDTAGERDHMCEPLRLFKQRLPLTAGVFLTQDLTAGEEQGYLAEYAEPTIAGGVRFEIRREIDLLSAQLWAAVTHRPNGQAAQTKQDHRPPAAK